MENEIDALKDELRCLGKFTELLLYLFYFEKFKDKTKAYYLSYLNFWKEKTAGLRNYQQQFLKFSFSYNKNNDNDKHPLSYTFLKIRAAFLESR